MTYELLIADRSHSSWSLRGWLCFAAFDLPVKVISTRLYEPGFQKDLETFAPARTVPVARTPEGGLLTDSIAIAETLAERFPDAGLWPEDPVRRALARSLVAEMHSGFSTLREECPMNLRDAYAESPVSGALAADLDRLQTLWAETPDEGPWLFGRYSLADVFYAPVAMRIASYALPVGPAARDYVDAHLNHLPLRRWRALGLLDEPQSFYFRDYPRTTWPGPKPVPATAVPKGPSINEACPYSGKAVTHFLETGGRIYGFCNAICRDKTALDPEAFPEFVSLADLPTVPADAIPA